MKIFYINRYLKFLIYLFFYNSVTRNGTKDKNSMRRQCSKEEEEVQSYSEWKVFLLWMKMSSWKLFRRFHKSVIYILPVGPFPEEMLSSLVSPQLSFLQALITFGEAFFIGMSIKVLPVIEYKEIGCKTRLHHKTGQLQLFLPGKTCLLYTNNVKGSFFCFEKPYIIITMHICNFYIIWSQNNAYRAFWICAQH